jgi:hypothetical protein
MRRTLSRFVYDLAKVLFVVWVSTLALLRRSPFTLHFMVLREPPLRRPPEIALLLTNQTVVDGSTLHATPFWLGADGR